MFVNVQEYHCGDEDEQESGGACKREREIRRSYPPLVLGVRHQGTGLTHVHSQLAALSPDRPSLAPLLPDWLHVFSLPSLTLILANGM